MSRVSVLSKADREKIATFFNEELPEEFQANPTLEVQEDGFHEGVALSSDISICDAVRCFSEIGYNTSHLNLAG
jgi:hypothetical protein